MDDTSDAQMDWQQKMIILAKSEKKASFWINLCIWHVENLAGFPSCLPKVNSVTVKNKTLIKTDRNFKTF